MTITTQTADRFAELLDLEPGWLDGDGRRITPESVAAAREVLTAQGDAAETSGVFPTEEGGVQLEWVDRARQLVTSAEVLPDGRVEVFQLDVARKAAVDHPAAAPAEAAVTLRQLLAA